MEDDCTGISNLPQSVLDKYKENIADSPKSRKKWVNSFVEK